MSQSLAALERHRSAVLSEIIDLGDFRSGSISAISGRCGKPDCRCHQPGQPAHGPNFRLTRKVNGKTVSETFAAPAQRRKAQREVDNFQRFRELSRQLLDVNEQICRLRPVEEDAELSPRKKNGRSDPARSRPRSRAAPAGRLRRSAQEREAGPGSGRTSDARRPASSRRGADRDALERGASERIATAVRLWQTGALGRPPPQEDRHNAGRSRRRTAVLSLQSLRRRLRASRPRVGR